jgi:hypothetical protein
LLQLFDGVNVLLLWGQEEGSMIRTLFILSLLIATGVSPASTIYNNGQASGQYPVWSDTTSYAADGFMLASGGTTIRQVHWWGGYGVPWYPDELPFGLDTFVISIYEDVGGAPALNPVFEVPVTPYARAYARPDYFDVDIYAYSAHLGNVTLQANVPYYLSITNTARRWLWYESCHNCSTNFVRTDPSASWESDWQRLNLAFNLTDDPLPVPEPSSLVLLAAGVTGLAIWRRGGAGA